jgi:hypothetical protein
MRLADLARYGLWIAVVRTAARNRKEYGVPTAWLTHLVGNTITLLLPDKIRLVRRMRLPAPSDPAILAILRTIDQRAREDQRYAAYVAPLALGFIASHPDYSIYHGRMAEHQIMGFGLDSVPHASAAYALVRLLSQSIVSLHQELPGDHALAEVVEWAAEHVDLVMLAVIAAVTLVWEVGEYQAHHAEIAATGRSPEEVNMQWSLSDTVTDSIANLAGTLAAIAVRRRGL